MNSQPTPAGDRLFAPNVYLFAYTLIDGAENKHNPLWEHGDQILGYFTDEKITDNLDFSNGNDSKGDRIYLMSDDAIGFSSKKYPGIEGFAQAQKIQDSYALWLNIGYPDQDETAEPVPVESLQQFNPNHTLSLPQAEKFLGQTLLITAWLTTKTQSQNQDYLRNLADQCCQSLLGENAPPFDRAGELFGSPIFAYGKPKQPDKYPHVLVWLFRDETGDRQYDKYQQELIALFLYRHKIVKAFQNSRLVYDHLDRVYRDLEDNLDRLQIELNTPHDVVTNIELNTPHDVVTNDDYLEKFKTQLKTFATESLSYTRFLRSLEDYHNTIETNLYNYNQIIKQICATIEDDENNLYFLRIFGQETAPLFQGQIESNLGYFRHGTDLINTAIASIRGIVEIDQAERDRQREKTEKQNRDKQKKASDDLQDLIQALGVGIAAGAIVASSSGLITQPWYFPNGRKIEFDLIPHPFFIGLIASFICSLGSWWMATKVIKNRREKAQQQDQKTNPEKPQPQKPGN
jgi:hypothetical protein